MKPRITTQSDVDQYLDTLLSQVEDVIKKTESVKGYAHMAVEQADRAHKAAAKIEQELEFIRYFDRLKNSTQNFES